MSRSSPALWALVVVGVSCVTSQPDLVGGVINDLSLDNSPRGVAMRVSDSIIRNQDIFFVWDYGGALVFDGLQYCSDVFGLNYTSITYKYLDDFKQQPWAYGFKLLHDIPIPRGEAVGDTVGLFPIAYLDRILGEAQNHTHAHSAKTDWEIVYKVADRVLTWTKRLSDGTISRDHGWRGEPHVGDTFVWADDQFMGLVLLARLAHVTKNTSLVQYISKQALMFVTHLRDTTDGLYYHGYNDADGHVSCCKWGRANGWAMFSHVEVLGLLDGQKYLIQQFEDVLSAFRTQSEALLKFQGSDGRFHQVINETSTFLETSATAMILTAWARAVREDWLPRHTYDTAIWRAWRGLCSTVKADGTVTGICGGTGIQECLSQYENRPCFYLLSGDGGLGNVLHASAEMERYITWSKNK